MNGVLIKWIDKAAGTYDVIRYAQWPAMDLDLVLGNDIPYEWFMPFEANTAPDYDPRLWILNSTTGPSELPHPEHPVHKQWRTEFALEKRSMAQILISVKEAEANSNAALMNSSEGIKTLFLSGTVQEKLLKGIELTAEDQAVLDRRNEMSVKITQNAARAAELILLVEAGNEPNLDEGWQTDNFSSQGFPFNQ
jgi:hypothetical protein